MQFFIILLKMEMEELGGRIWRTLGGIKMEELGGEEGGERGGGLRWRRRLGGKPWD